MFYSDYRDFYQTAFIPIGANDRKLLHNDHCSHWLIALAGQAIDHTSGFYCWKIVVIPATSEGIFNWNDQHYISESYHCIHQAFVSAKDIARLTLNDALETAKVKIS